MSECDKEMSARKEYKKAKENFRRAVADLANKVVDEVFKE